MSGRPRFVPPSTYRLQINPEFPFAAAETTVAYLARLGAGAVYTSPYFAAAPGSTHGYDVCNHNEINPELGGVDGHRAFTHRASELGLQHVVDFVPNHMGIGTGRNAWWRDVLENGPGSRAARFFDVDWTPVRAELHAKLLLPILGDQYGNVLERGELRLELLDGALVLRYFEHELPTNPQEAPRVLRRAVEPLTQALGADHPQLHELMSILASLQNMPPYTDQREEAIGERQREKEVARARLARLMAESPLVTAQLEAAVQSVNGEPGRPDSFDAMHELLEAQPYRLSYWRTASHEINYRRFFDINTLVGLRVEDREVFLATHELLRTLIATRAVTAVRVDHPDGLFDPARYFSMLQDLAADAWQMPAGWQPLWVAAEKILSAGEKLPKWAIHGTTGYNYLNDLNGLFVNGVHASRMRRAYVKLTGRTEPFDDVVYASKRLIMETAMASELNVLAHMLDRMAESNRRSRDFTLESLRSVIAEVVACFPVYRTYVDERGWTPEDRAIVVRAVGRARRRNPAMEASLFDFLLEVILPRAADEGPAPGLRDRRGGYPPADAREAAERLRFSMKLQQYTGPVQAKGLEDTAFYRYNVLLSLNEVGGDPERFGRTHAEFHAANARRLAEWPLEMLSTATHDTKLGEDVRARINVLSEIPDEWSREASRWMRLNRSHRTMLDGELAPERNDEYRFYQALLGVWNGGLSPGFVERLQAYMVKSVKEAKRHTSWITPNDAYEAAVTAFVERVLTGPGAGKFLAAFLPLQRRIALGGMVNSLAQVALKLLSPGVPDFYQGTELWDYSLVDPDNRRSVDFDTRTRLLDGIDALLALEPGARADAVGDLVRNWPDGRIKLLLTAAGLRLRREDPELFLSGAYVPLETEVTVSGSLIAFARTLGDRAVVAAVPRLCAPMMASGDLPLGGNAWKTSRILLPPALAGLTWRHELTGAEIHPASSETQTWLFAGQVFEHVPVGVLTGDSRQSPVDSRQSAVGSQSVDSRQSDGFQRNQRSTYGDDPRDQEFIRREWLLRTET